MKRFLSFCCFLLPFFACAQPKIEHVTLISRDNVKYDHLLNENWRFCNGDSPEMAAKDYDDSKCEIYDPAHHPSDSKEIAKYFEGIRWWRQHILFDSNTTSLQFAIYMSHFGASEIYLDGKQVISFGQIRGRDSSIYVDPKYIPFVIPSPGAGEHVLAVRYANYNAVRNFNIYHNSFGGFHIAIGQANSLIRYSHRTATRFTAIIIFLFGIFLSLFLLHLFLYLFYRSERSNLYFSIFNLSFAVTFYLTFINRFTTSPQTQLDNSFLGLIIATLICFSFSGSVNILFSKKKLRFRIITVLCILFPVLSYLHIGPVEIMLLLMVCIVLLEAIILTIAAIFRKVRGARIIGFGILFFALFFLTIIVFTLTTKNFDFNDSTTGGQILFIIAAAALLSIPGSMSIYLAWSFASIHKDLELQLKQVKLLSERSLQQEMEKKQMLETRKEELEKEVASRTEEVIAQKKEIEQQHDELKIEKKKSDDLLLNILPEEVAEELKQKGSSEARFFDHVTVLFTDFVDFTKAGERMGPQELVDELHTCFKAFDGIISKYNIEKIKTIGDAYLAVCGLPLPDAGHAVNAARAALEIRQYMEDRKKTMGDKTFDIRIGIHSGSVVAGIVGVKKFAYDIWGDTVNTAARMEQSSEKGRINISQVTYELVKEQFECTHRGEIAAKNKGDLNMYFIEKEK
jgi:adenylate cyclase